MFCAVVQPDNQLATGTGPGLIGLPDVDIALRGGVILQAAVARCHRLFNRAGDDRQPIGIIVDRGQGVNAVVQGDRVNIAPGGAAPTAVSLLAAVIASTSVQVTPSAVIVAACAVGAATNRLSSAVSNNKAGRLCKDQRTMLRRVVSWSLV